MCFIWIIIFIKILSFIFNCIGVAIAIDDVDKDMLKKYLGSAFDDGSMLVLCTLLVRAWGVKIGILKIMLLKWCDNFM